MSWRALAGLRVGDRGGIVIDDACRTSDPDIFAIGECALWKGKIYGLVAPGYQMAGIVASQLQGDSEARFAGADMSTKLKLMGVDVASIGDAHAAASGARACVFIDERRQIYKKLVVSEDGTRLLGGILVGGAEEYGTWLQMVQNGLPLPANPEQLLFPPTDRDRRPSAARVLPVCPMPRRFAPATTSARAICAPPSQAARGPSERSSSAPRRQVPAAGARRS